MPTHLNTLIVLADAEHARFVRPEPEDNSLHSSGRAAPRGGAPGARDDAHARAREILPIWVATELNQQVALYDQLYIAAPAHTLNRIRLHLGKAAQAKLREVLDKDLTWLQDHELWPHLRQWLCPVYGARLPT